MGSIKTSKLIRSVYINNALDEYLQQEAKDQSRTVSQVLSLIIEKHIKEKHGTDQQS